MSNFDFTSVGLSNFMNTTGRETGKTEEFFKLWVERCGKPSSLIFDTTSISTYGNLLQAEWGYNRDGDSLPQVNFTLVSGREQGLPLFYRLVPGSVPDVKLVQHTVMRLEDFGMKNFKCALDRGFYSAGNVRTLLEDKTGFVLGTPMSCNQTRDLIKKHKAAMSSPKASIMFQGNVVRHAKDKWVVDMGKGEKMEIAAHVYMDPKRRADAVASIERTVFELENKLSEEIADGRVSNIFEGKEWINQKAGLLKGCLSVEQDADGSIKVSRCVHTIATITGKKGHFVVITDDDNCSGEVVLADYRSRDSIEKLFDILKNETEQHRVRSGKEHVGAGRLFLAFISMILHREMENRLRLAKQLKNYTVSEVLSEMRKLKAVKTPAGRVLLMEITKRQRKLFAAMKMAEPV
ncbi:MAG: IS1634 family transposase [Desulfamplus sp.]|nr:IS1634 family transposase [Desulfamplus sp.]